MPETSLLLILLLIAVVVAIVLLFVLLLRKPDTRLEQALRDEQREGRSELRQQLDSLSTQQEQRIEGFAGRLMLGMIWCASSNCTYSFEAYCRPRSE